MAYKSKYYNPAKAHEYYMKHRQLKGRKKATSTADLNEAGKIAAKEVKEQLQAELKAALKKVKKGNTAERKRLRELYAKKYEEELENIRKDSSMLKQKKEKAAKTSKASSKGSKGSSKGGSKGGSSSGSQSVAQSTQPSTQATAPEPQKVSAEQSARITKCISDLKSKFSEMTEEQKTAARDIIKRLMDYFKG